MALVIAARLLGPEDFGKFAALQGISLFLTTLIGMGLTTWGVRNLARGYSQNETLDPSLAIAVVGSALLMVGAITVGPLLLEIESLIPLLLLQVYALSGFLAGIFNTVFWARERMFPTAVLAATEKILLVAWVGLLYLFGDLTLFSLSLAYAVVGLFKAGVTFTLLVHLRWWRPQRTSRAAMLRVAKEAWPFGTTAAVQSLSNRLETPILALHSPVWAGLYAGAFKFLEGTYYLVQAACVALLPTATKVANRSQTDFRILATSAISGAFLVGVLVALVYLFAGDELLDITLGSSYGESGQLLMVLALGIPAVFANMVASALLVAAEAERLVLGVSVLAQSVRLGAMALLPGIIGLDGSALAVLLGVGVALAFFTVALMYTVRNHRFSAASVSARAA